MSEDEMIGRNKEYEEINKSIVELEKELLKIAPDDIKKLYLQIDFLCCKQQALFTEILKKS